MITYERVSNIIDFIDFKDFIDFHLFIRNSGIAIPIPIPIFPEIPIFSRDPEIPDMMRKLSKISTFILAITFLTSCLYNKSYAAPTDTSATMELYWSQQSIINPCDGNPITFDFGHMKFNVMSYGDVMSGTVYLQQTIRTMGDLFSQKEDGIFAIQIPPNTRSQDAVLRFDVPETQFNFIYKVRFILQSSKVQSVTLEEIQVGKC